MTREEQVALIRHKYVALAPLLNERTRRCWAATEAQALGYGGISLVAEALGAAPGPFIRGLGEDKGRGKKRGGSGIGSFGGGRKKPPGKKPGLGGARNNRVE